MTARILDRVVLGAASLVLVGVGAGATVVPEVFYTGYGIDATTTAVANELRAAGGALLLLGVLVGAGAVWRRATFPAAVVAASVLLGYAIGRGVSLLVDGMPDSSMLVAGTTELVLGTAAAWVAVRTRPQAPVSVGRPATAEELSAVRSA